MTAVGVLHPRLKSSQTEHDERRRELDRQPRSFPTAVQSRAPSLRSRCSCTSSRRSWSALQLLPRRSSELNICVGRSRFQPLRSVSTLSLLYRCIRNRRRILVRCNSDNVRFPSVFRRTNTSQTSAHRTLGEAVSTSVTVRPSLHLYDVLFPINFECFSPEGPRLTIQRHE